MKKAVIMGVCLWALVGVSEAKTIRAIQLQNTQWSDLGSLGDVIIEFQKGDELPVRVNASGDLLETSRPSVSYVAVKRDFWLKAQKDKIQFSLDGVTFKELNESLRGSIEAGTGADESGGIANAININFKAFLK
ncbi:hypothetical protein AZI86_09220 [Bdellovibrio bacteriovorus]|uniref:Uncharacterized protein n=1 Tax=Bdellovibrio bacteriovorus TaxID=959 RepID=A0A150WSD1_BDEBC|nr:hypothetical protein [Bdellovibrio bacteriovorus]KYG67179.1 hypothetical protein AZI86_09220 [Bdellovibrio bacteriovorus]